jgi:hypothetical protein
VATTKARAGFVHCSCRSASADRDKRARHGDGRRDKSSRSDRSSRKDRDERDRKRREEREKREQERKEREEREEKRKKEEIERREKVRCKFWCRVNWFMLLLLTLN